MEHLGAIGKLELYRPSVDDVHPQLARTIMGIEGAAYQARFGDIPRVVIDDVFELDPNKDLAINLDNLCDPDWFWVLGFYGKCLSSFAIFEPLGKTIEIAELHTHPKRARQGDATAVMRSGLQIAIDHYGVTEAALYVDRRSPWDNHPYLWYQRLGFRVEGVVGEITHLEDVILQKYRMRADAQVVLKNLNARIG